MDKQFYAHLKHDGNTIVTQSVKEHSLNVAAYAYDNLVSVSLGETAKISGLLHDMGKCNEDFQNYLIEGGKRGSVIHTFQGLKYCLKQFDSSNLTHNLTKEIISFVIGSHHSLFDCIDSEHKSGFRYRYEKKDINYEESIFNYFNNVVSEKSIETLFEKSEKEVNLQLLKINEIISSKEKSSELYFYLSILCRLILSAVIDGDHQDTFEFMFNSRIDDYVSKNAKAVVWNDICDNVERKLKNFSNFTEINKARKWISNKCLESANYSPGIYRLNVPTGAGKTLSSLRFAVNHAKKHNASRIIFVSPLLSILDQNSMVLREYIGNDDYVLEHHSNIVRDKEEFDEISKDDIAKETWNSPIIITTFVQLLNTMFAGKSSNIRRFSSLCNSVIVIDEIQTLPTKMISMFNLMCNYLSYCCNTTIVFCSATQPTLENVHHGICVPVKDLVAYDKKIWDVFQRTEIVDAGIKDEDEVINMIIELNSIHKSVLLICNTKKEASMFTEKLQNKLPNKTDLFHLSANLCMKHRKKVIIEMKKSLEELDKHTIMISTQIIEAGVDVSFSSVIRIAAGIDSIIQAAGRCNRNNEQNGISNVYIIRLKKENLTSLEDIKESQTATIGLLDDYQKHREKYDNHLDSLKSQEKYYKNFYNSKYVKNQMNYPRKLNNGTLYDLLSINMQYADERIDVNDQILRQSFKTVCEEFEVFDQKTIDIIVPFDTESKEIIEELCAIKESDFKEITRIMNKLKPYTVNIYENQLKKLNEQHVITSTLEETIFILDDERYYDGILGLVLEPQKKMELLEV